MNFFTAFLLLALGHAVHGQHAAYTTPSVNVVPAVVTCAEASISCTIPDVSYMTIASNSGFGNAATTYDWQYQPLGYATLPATCVRQTMNQRTFTYNKFECGMTRTFGVGKYGDLMMFVPDMGHPYYPNKRMFKAFEDGTTGSFACPEAVAIISIPGHAATLDVATRNGLCAQECIDDDSCWGFTDLGVAGAGCRYCSSLTDMTESAASYVSYRKEVIKGVGIDEVPAGTAPSLNMEFEKTASQLKMYYPPSFACTCEYPAYTTTDMAYGTVASQEATFEQVEEQNIFGTGSAVKALLTLHSDESFASGATNFFLSQVDNTYASHRWFLEAATGNAIDHLDITACRASPASTFAEATFVTILADACTSSAIFNFKEHNLNHDLTNTDRVSFRLFKFDDSEVIHFQCDIQLLAYSPPACPSQRRLTKINKTGKNPLRKLQTRTGTGQTQTVSAETTKFHPEADYFTVPTTKDMYGRSKWTKQDTKNSLLNAVFGSDKADKLKTTSLFVKSSVKSYAHGKVEGSISLPGNTATLWATNTNARSSLEASLKQSMELNNGEHVHITNVAEVSVQARGRSLMAKLTKQTIPSNLKHRRLQTATSIAQVDYTIELASASSPSFVETAVMGLALDKKIVGTFATTLNSELAKRGLPAQSITADSTKFGMPTVQLSAASQQQATQNQAAAQQQNTVVRDSQPATQTQVQTASSSGDDLKLFVLGALGLAGVIVVLAGAYQLMNKK